MEQTQPDAAAAFAYEPLPSQKSIRLIDLLPPAADGTIRCQLRAVELDQEPSPVFTALSYEWRDPYPNEEALPYGDTSSASEGAIGYQPILLNDACFKVRANLWKFLDSLGRSKLAADGCFWSVWVDAVCINQADINEKNHQVHFMRTIYSRADRVVIWLGRGGSCAEFEILVEEQSEVASWMRDQQKSHKNLVGDEMMMQERADWQALESLLLPEWEEAHAYVKYDWPQSPRAQSAMKWLRSRSFWSRLWVIQETLLPRRLLIMFGGAVISWEAIAAVVTWRHEVVSPRGMFSKFSVIYKWRHQGTRRKMYIEEAIEDFADFECEDFRDKVFGLLSLMRGGESFPINYADSGRAILFKALQHFQEISIQEKFVDRLVSALRFKEYARLGDNVAPPPQTCSAICETPVRKCLRSEVAIHCNILLLRSRHSKVSCCFCPTCRRYQPDLKRRTFFHDLEIWFCAPVPHSSSLGFLFVKDRSLEHALFLAAVEIPRKPDDRGVTSLLVHDPGIPNLSSTCLTKGRSGELSSVKVAPEVLDAMLFRYSRSTKEPPAPKHRSNAWQTIRPAHLGQHPTRQAHSQEAASSSQIPSISTYPSLPDWITPILEHYFETF